MVLRASSLQSGRNESLPYPVVRQFSSPSMHHEKLPSTTNRTRTYTVDIQNPGCLLRKLFSPSQSHRSCVAEECEKMPVKRLLSSASAVSDETNDDDELYEEAFDLTNGRLMSEEEREYGKISKLIYLEYLCACGVLAGLTYLVSAVVWQGLRVYTDYWLSQWTNENGVDSEQIKYYLVVYAGLSVASIFLSLTSNGIGQYAGAKARRILHDKMLCNILYCPMKFFESTPVGRVINRFSADTGVIDKKLATSIQRLLQFLLLCFSAIFVNAVVTTWFLLIAVLICLFYYLVQHFYRCSSRELQRLDGITRSPIFSHFSETLTGLTTIRAFGHQQRFMDLLLQKMDVHTNAFLIMNTANRWLGIALDYLGAVIVFVAILTALVTASVYQGMVTPALVGLAVNYTLLIPIYLNWVVKFLADMEMYMGAVERVQQYANTPTEDYRREGTSVSQSWPDKGDILFENVSLCYDKSRDPIITNLNLHIPAGQKVGLCGRTGCGKSSLVMSLFNMVEVYEGSIKIDGVDISKVPLQLLRSRLSIIPQDVIMFSGTIRDNLDPNHKYPDHELWRSLELSQLANVVHSYPGGLDSEVREGGENLSVGERQLFCLARAILHNAACLVMDEATSSVDHATERALMAAAAKAFSTRTVINIAHRLPTILDCDRIIVLDGGKVVEDGTPTELLHHPLSILTSMLRASEETPPR